MANARLPAPKNQEPLPPFSRLAIYFERIRLALPHLEATTTIPPALDESWARFEFAGSNGRWSMRLSFPLVGA